MAIESKLQKGMNIEWLVKRTMPPAQGAVVVEANIETTPSGERYIFLPWNSSGISQVINAGVDVISGPFSGCLMTARIQGGANGGARYVSHINKGGAYDSMESWGKIKADSSDVIEFNPFKHISDADLVLSTTLAPGVMPDCFGIITGTGACYAVLAVKNHVIKQLKV